MSYMEEIAAIAAANPGYLRRDLDALRAVGTEDDAHLETVGVGYMSRALFAAFGMDPLEDEGRSSTPCSMPCTSSCWSGSEHPRPLRGWAANQPHPIGTLHKSGPKSLCNLPIDRPGLRMV